MDVKPQIALELPHAAEEEERLGLAENVKGTMIWAVKVPRFLLERWERVPEAGVELGTLVVDNSVVPAKVTLRLPDTSQIKEEPAETGSSRRKPLMYDTNGIPDEYEVNVPVDRARNTWVFNERVRTWAEMGGGPSREGQAIGKRKREKANPRLIGAVQHECSVKPIDSAQYRKVLLQRRLEAEQSKRPIIPMDGTGLSRGKLNQLASGYANANSVFGKGLVSRKSVVAAGEKFARLERNELVDRLFAMFRDKPYWGMGAMRAQLQQPDAWLREVLADVAVMIREGPYKNYWELKESWKNADAPGQRQEQEAASGEEVKVAKDEEDEDMDDDDEEDFEEILE